MAAFSSLILSSLLYGGCL